MKYYLSILSIFIFTLSFSQEPVIHKEKIQYNSLFPLNRDMMLTIERLQIVSPDTVAFHSEQKPYFFDFNAYAASMLFNKKLKDKTKRPITSFIYNKILVESFINIHSDDADLTIDPLFNFGYGKFNSNEASPYNTTYINTRGFIIRGAIGKKRNVTFFSSLYENQGRFIDYVDSRIIKLKKNNPKKPFFIIPGEGMAKPFRGETSSQYDYSSATGLVSYSPSSHFNFQFGHSKNFIGDGYRSLLLSDNSFNYPFLKTKFNFGRFEYTNIYASFMVPYPEGENIFTKKYATMHLLGWNPDKSINISLFESTMWKAKDGSLNLPFKAKYLNPIIGLQTMSTGLNRSDNTMAGLNVRINIRKHHSVYAQLVVDDLDFTGKGNYNNKLGLQLGYKYFDVLNIKNLYFQTEYNAVKPYTYAHKDSVQSYSHYDQPLAHPLGANFRESVTFLNYRWREFLFELKYNYAVYGADISKYDFGQNILLSQNPDKYAIDLTQSKIAQGVRNTLIYKSFRVYYLLNPITNMNIYFEFQDRKQTSGYRDYHSTYFNFGLKTNLDNFYYDF